MLAVKSGMASALQLDNGGRRLRIDQKAQISRRTTRQPAKRERMMCARMAVKAWHAAASTTTSPDGAVSVQAPTTIPITHGEVGTAGAVQSGAPAFAGTSCVRYQLVPAVDPPVS